MTEHKGNTNRQLTAARKARKDEFYTTKQIVEEELHWYQKDFQGRPVLCNCNDWPESEFVKFFMKKMASWNIPNLYAVGYENTVGTLFEKGHGTLYELENDGRPADQPYTEKDFKTTELEGSGGFETPECERLLDIPGVIVCTNPPFSLTKVMLPTLVAHGCGFLVMGNINAVTYKEIFPLFLNSQCWLGVSLHGKRLEFKVPDEYPLTNSTNRVDDEGNRFITINGSVRWFTNLASGKIGKNELSLEGNYYVGHEARYPKYDNYDAINVDKVADIPIDYFDEMGVPITFLDKWAPDSGGFEITGRDFEQAGPITEREREREKWCTRNASTSTGEDSTVESSSDIPACRECGQLPTGRVQSGDGRLCAWSQEVQTAYHPTFRLIGEINHGKDGPWDKAATTIQGRSVYKRLLIRRNNPNV